MFNIFQKVGSLFVPARTRLAVKARTPWKPMAPRVDVFTRAMRVEANRLSGDTGPRFVLTTLGNRRVKCEVVGQKRRRLYLRRTGHPDRQTFHRLRARTIPLEA